MEIIDAAANFDAGEYCTLILDRAGRIVSCGAAAERMFAASQIRLIGRWIHELIAGLFRSESSPSYSARYMVYLCSDGEWRKFEARDEGGRRFGVELNLSRIVTDGEEMLLLNVRRLQQTELA